MEIKGHGGTTVVFDGAGVTIKRTGFLSRATVGKGEKRLPIGSITAVQWKPAGGMVNGFIQFTVPGGVEKRSSFGRQTTDAAHDENSVVFTKKQMPDFAKLREAVQSAIEAQQQPSAAPSAPDVTDQLRKLGELRAAGVLTDTEFENKKAELLNRL